MKKIKTQIFWPQLINNTPQGWIQLFISKLTEEWRNLANVFNGHHDAVTIIQFAAQTAAPTSPVLGSIVLADRANWDPLSKGSGGAYFVWWNGSAWRPLDLQ